MRNLVFFLVMTFSAPLSFAQSAGGGGGGDRPRVWTVGMNGPVQIDSASATCHELKTALRIFGKVRVNKPHSEKPVYDVVFLRSLDAPCSSSRDLTRFRIKTSDKTFCTVGYKCGGGLFGK